MPLTPLQFTAADYFRATRGWGANCGVVSLAGITGKSPNEVKPHIMPEFEQLAHVSHSLMETSLERIGVRWRDIGKNWPIHGVVALRWMRRCESSLPQHTAYRHWGGAHWICVSGDRVFDGFDTRRWGWNPIAHWLRNMLPELTGIRDPIWPLWRIAKSIEITGKIQ